MSFDKAFNRLFFNILRQNNVNQRWLNLSNNKGHGILSWKVFSTYEELEQPPPMFLI